MRITTWKGSLFDKEPYTDNYRDFRQKRGVSVPPLEAPLSLPALPDGIAPGKLPTAEQLLRDLAHADCTALHPEVQSLLPSFGVVSNLCKKFRFLQAWPPEPCAKRLLCLLICLFSDRERSYVSR